jgi:hypothetical protein
VKNADLGYINKIRLLSILISVIMGMPDDVLSGNDNRLFEEIMGRIPKKTPDPPGWNRPVIDMITARSATIWHKFRAPSATVGTIDSRALENDK